MAWLLARKAANTAPDTQLLLSGLGPVGVEGLAAEALLILAHCTMLLSFLRGEALRGPIVSCVER